MILVSERTTSSISIKNGFLNKLNKIFEHLVRNLLPFKANFPIVSILKEAISLFEERQ